MISFPHEVRKWLPKTINRRGTPEMFERITVNPDIHFGKPCIEGTRIPVQDVLELLAEGLSFEQIIKDYYPDINAEDIRACLRYAAALVAAEDIDLTSIPA